MSERSAVKTYAGVERQGQTEQSTGGWQRHSRHASAPRHTSTNTVLVLALVQPPAICAVIV